MRRRTRRPRPEAEAIQHSTTIMVLRMLGSAAAVLGSGGGGGGGGGHSSNTRALVAAAVSTTTNKPMTSSARSFFRALGGGIPASGSRATSAFVSSSSSSSASQLLLARKVEQQQQQRQQQRYYNFADHQRRDRSRSTASPASTAVSMNGGLMGTVLDGLSSSTGSTGRRHHQRPQHGVQQRCLGGGSLRLMSTAGGTGGEGEGFWADDAGGFEEPSTFLDRDSSGHGGAAARPWEEPAAADAAEAGFLQEEDDETEWMAGQDVDPEAEAIFFGDKVPFSNLGLNPALCGHLEALGIGHSTAVQVGYHTTAAYRYHPDTAVPVCHELSTQVLCRTLVTCCCCCYCCWCCWCCLCAPPPDPGRVVKGRSVQ